MMMILNTFFRENLISNVLIANRNSNRHTQHCTRTIMHYSINLSYSGGKGAKWEWDADETADKWEILEQFLKNGMVQSFTLVELLTLL